MICKKCSCVVWEVCQDACWGYCACGHAGLEWWYGPQEPLEQDMSRVALEFMGRRNFLDLTKVYDRWIADILIGRHDGLGTEALW